MGKTSSAEAPHEAADRFESIPLDLIDENPSNTRKRFDESKLEELAESIRQHGVVEPILVRPYSLGGRFEAIFGARRIRASRMAGKESIPAIVRQLGDADALEITVIENLQRDDLHPLEEAEGYEQLLQQQDRPYTVNDIAAKVGKSKAYVYGRMKLLALCPAGRKAFYEDKLNASVALLLARIPVPELQEKALDEVLSGGEFDMHTGENEPMSYRDAQDHIIDTYTLRLGDAPFKKDDLDLVPGAGACTTCPKRTGAQPELFADVKSGDVCTDPVCFAEKKKADWNRTKAEAKEKGAKLLTEKESARVFDRYNEGRLNPYGQPYVKLTDKCEEDPKHRTWKQLLAGEAPEKVLARDPRGRVHELLDKTAAAAALKKAGHSFKVDLPEKPAAPVSKEEREEQERREEEKRKLKDAVAHRVSAAIAEAATRQEPDDEFWRIVAQELLRGTSGDVFRRRFKVERYIQPAEAEKHLKKLVGGELRGLVLELALEQTIFDNYRDDGMLTRALKWAGVDLKALEKQVRDELAAEKPAEEKKPAKKGARRG